MAVTPVNTQLICDRRKRTLQLWTRPLLAANRRSYQFVLEKTYDIAVGAAGYKTPAGLYLINSRSPAPTWTVPSSSWAPKRMRGKVVQASDPDNPIKARWLGVTDPEDGVGIHGTDNEASIGTAASHGCLRMRVPDVIELFDKVKLYTPITIH